VRNSLCTDARLPWTTSTDAPHLHRATRQGTARSRAHQGAGSPYLSRVTVAPITSSVRGLSTEVAVGPAQDLDRESAVSCENILTIPVGSLGSRWDASADAGDVTRAGDQHRLRPGVLTRDSRPVVPGRAGLTTAGRGGPEGRSGVLERGLGRRVAGSRGVSGGRSSLRCHCARRAGARRVVTGRPRPVRRRVPRPGWGR